jgi:kexin
MKVYIAALLASLTFFPIAANAADTYYPATKRVNVGSIVVGNTRYRDVLITVGSILRVGNGTVTGTEDAYDRANNQLTIRSIVANGTTYTDVVITVGSIISVGSSAPLNTEAPNDPLFQDQWHLKNTGQIGQDAIASTAGEDLNILDAWNLATGSGIQIAIVDDGLDINHEDLNVVAGKSWDYIANAYGDPSSDKSSHGTSCGGLSAAKGNNAIGVTGVAFNAQVVGYNLLSATTGSYGADAVTKDLSSNHVYSNSYGSADSRGTLDPSDEIWRQAIDTGTSTGRNGKGAIYTWAAGNGSPTDRSDYDGQANYHGVLAIGSLNDKGKKSSYSEAGSNLLVSTFGGEYCSSHTTTTVDVTGTGGYNNGTSSENDYSGKPNYTRCMNGTSAATPEASGVAALILETNSALTWRDVRLILASTARKNDTDNSDWVTNGGGYHVNHNYGYGAVDATAAVSAARNWVNIPVQKKATGAATTPAAIPDAGVAATSEISISNSAISKIEFVNISVTSDHPDVSELSITLTSPSNTVSTLTVPHDCKDASEVVVSCGSAFSTVFRFGVARLMGEVADGKWLLKIQDSKSGKTGSLVSWNLQVMGY